jgi:hypothetical protein
MLASHVLDNFEVIESRLPICTDVYVRGILSSTVSEGIRPARKSDSPSRSKSEGIRCFRGSLVALGLEAAMALFAYGIWEAWHILR